MQKTLKAILLNFRTMNRKIF